MATFDLYINLRPETGRPAFVQSSTNGAPLQLPAFYREEKRSLRVFCQSPNPTGGFAAPFTADDMAAYDCRVGIGAPGGAVLCVEELSWNAADDCFEGVLTINTTEMNAALDDANGADISQTFEVEIKTGSEEFTFQQAVTIKNEVLTVAGGIPDDATETLFADRLEDRFLDSDTVDVARTGDDFKWHVRRKTGGGIGADTDGIFAHLIGNSPGLLAALSAGFSVGAGFAASPTSGSDVETAGGVAGTLYAVKARVFGTVEIKNHTGGTQRAGDNARVYRGGTPAADNQNLWYLDISDPPQRIHLNHQAGAVATVSVDYYVDFLVAAGATVTLAYNTIDALSLAANSVTVTPELMVEALPDPRGRHTLWVPASAMTPRATDGAASDTSETGTNQVMLPALEFDADTAQYAQFNVGMPKGWNRGTVAAEFLWYAPSGTGSVRWGLQGLARGDGDALDTAFGTAQFVADAIGTVNTLRTSAESSAISIGGSPAERDLVTFQVFRDAADGADTFDSPARLLGVRLFYTTEDATDD